MQNKVTINIPFNYEAREYQKPFWKAMDTHRYAFILWHRRAGKEKTCLNFMIKKMVEEKGIYYYLFPTYQQGRKVLWEGMDKSAFKFMDHFPAALIAKKNDKQMSITLKNGSMMQIVGTDNYDTTVGTNPRGMIFSEYALQDPLAWSYFRPILAENKGWAIFNTTPRGENHAFKLWNNAVRDPSWFTQKLTVRDTGVLTEEEINVEKEAYFKEQGDDSLFLQEWFCDFNAPVKGTYYAHIIERLEKNGAMKYNLFDAKYPVSTWWDLGYNDTNSIWFTQSVGNQIRVIDYLQDSNKGLQFYINALKEKPYVYERHSAPHDIEVHDYSTGKTRLETARNMGVDFEVIPRLSIEEGIQAVRTILEQCVFDVEKCEVGLNCLKSYQKEYDEKNNVFKPKPLHNWASHGCLTGDTLIDTTVGKVQIKDIKIGDIVITPFGRRRVLDAGVTGMANKLIEIKTNRGNMLKVTAEHLIYKDLSLEYADTLGYADGILPNKSLWIWKIIKRVIQSNMKDTCLGWREAISSELVQKRFTKQSGRNIMVQYLKDISFIMLTSIPLIMTYPIFNFLQKRSTTSYMAKDRDGMAQKKILNNLKKSEQRQVSGMDQKKEQNFIHPLANFHGNIEQSSLESAMSAARSMGLIIQHAQTTAQKTVKVSKEESMVKIYQNVCVLFAQALLNVTNILKQERVAEAVKISLSKEIPVYDLKVEDDHCYFANNILVSNSDAFRYLSLGIRTEMEYIDYSTDRADNLSPSNEPW